MDTFKERTGANGSIIGKASYGALFVAVLPALLIVWALFTDSSVRLSPVESPSVGIVLSVIGIALVAAGMTAIIFFGKGLPMNAYPPERFVVEGAYRYLSHPIYVGFSILCFGVAIYTGSVSGFWIVAPCAVLGCVALVQGYEREATIKHFNGATAQPLLRLPAFSSEPAEISDRISTVILVAAPWLSFNFVTGTLARDLGTEFLFSTERTLPLIDVAGFSALSGGLLLLLVVVITPASTSLRRFVMASWVSIAISGLLFIVFPFSEVPLSAAGEVVRDGALLGSGFSANTTSALSLSVALLLLAGWTLGQPERWRTVLFNGWAIAGLTGGLLSGIYTVLDITLGAGIYLAARNIKKVWDLARSVAERIANSWTEWRFGPVRLIHHGLFAAAGSFIALAAAGLLAGPDNVAFVILITFLSIVMSAISAQWIEGSPGLLRPFGWYGGVVGAFLGALIVSLMGANTWLLIAAFCLAATIVQAGGRLRCLVQGCCHGRATSDEIGIRYVHPKSRVCRIAGLEGVPLHPTQLYSILCNLVVAIIILRLWFSGAPLSLIVGIYYILTGLGRFVEEAYRGEPQTPTFGSLRLYQIFAVFSVIGGIVATMLPGSGNAPPPVFNWESIVASAVFAVFVCFAFGVDFPASERRFARLT